MQNPPSSHEEDDLAQSLQSWEYRLREGGSHVVLDKDQVSLWVFSLSQAEAVGTAPTSGLGGLDCELPMSLYQALPLTRI